MQEYDVIVLKSPLGEIPIQAGMKGTILMVFGSPAKAYEVEFVDASNRSLGTFTVGASLIELLNAQGEQQNSTS
jgi:hypothetical protein